MAKTFYPFDAGAGGVVTEAEWETMARLWRTTGVVAGEASELAVSADGIDLTVDVAPGVCWIRGFYFGSDAIETLTTAAADPFDPRIDRIVVRLDRLNNLVDLAVLTGTPEAAPTPPSLTQGAVVWEIALAQVTVPAAATTIAAGNVADGRTIVASPSFVAGGTAPAEATGTAWVRQADGAYVPVDVATQAELDGHTAATSPHSSTAAATAARLVLRDAAARAKFADPAAAQDAATKGYVDGTAIPKALVDAAGDLIVGSGADAVARLAKGADGTVLGVAAGVVGWQPQSAGAHFEFVASSTSWSTSVTWTTAFPVAPLVVGSGIASTNYGVIVTIKSVSTTGASVDSRSDAGGTAGVVKYIYAAEAT